MIDTESLKQNWIHHIAHANRNADSILVEKVIRALYLLEQLQQQGLNFIFKGGTSLMLLLPEPKRLSIDIDIIVPDNPDKIEGMFDKIIEQSDFLEFIPDEREINSQIEKAHYKFYYKPVTNTRAEKEYILLDILYEESQYGHAVQQIPVQSPFINSTGEPVMVIIPTFEAILGDKLTAFAPNTTGVPYDKGKEIEIIKQLYDVANLFDYTEDVSVIRKVFYKTARTELKYRNLPEESPENVLDDIEQTALCIATRGKSGDGNFEELQRGIQNIRNFIFSESFHLEKAMVPAAKAAYIAALLKTGATTIEKYSNSTDMGSWEIKPPFNTRLNRFKRTNPEAFFYWYKAATMGEEK